MRNHCSGAREAATLRGWPETRCDPAPVSMARLIPRRPREAATLRGWPETRCDPAPVSMARFILRRPREAATLRGWPKTRCDPAPVSMARFIPHGSERPASTGGGPRRHDPAASGKPPLIPGRDAPSKIQEQPDRLERLGVLDPRLDAAEVGARP